MLLFLPLSFFAFCLPDYELAQNSATLVPFIVMPTIIWTKLRDQDHESPPKVDEPIVVGKTPEKQVSESQVEEYEKVILGISHDCRNLLNSLKAILTLMKDEANGEEIEKSNQDDYLQSAVAITEHLTLLLTNLLDYLRKNEDASSQEEMRLTSTLEKIWLMISPNLRKKNLGGSITIKNGTPLGIHLDERKFMGILLNIVGNAVKFTDAGHIKINVHWRESAHNSIRPDDDLLVASESLQNSDGPSTGVDFSLDERNSVPNKKNDSRANTVFSKSTFFDSKDIDSISFSKKCFTEISDAPTSADRLRASQGWLILTVRDTGCGIDEDSLKKLFKKYMQVGQDPEKSKLGYGLGLWYTKYLLGKLNGKIDFRSTKDVGTWVKIEIPCRIADYKPIVDPVNHEEDPCIFVRNNDNLETLIITEYLKKRSINHLEIIQANTIEEILHSKKLQAGGGTVVIVEEKSVTPTEIEALKIFKQSHEGKKLFTILLKDSSSSFVRENQETPKIECDFIVKKPIKYIQMEQIAKHIEIVIGQNLFRESFNPQSDDQPRVLLVDDEGIALTLLQRYFQKNGIHCLTAKDGVEAVEVYKKEAKNIKVIIMDSQMPRMGGIEATRAIRALGKNRGLQVIGHSGDASDEFKEEAFRNGMNQVLLKPAPLSELLQVVAQALDMKRY